MVFTSISYRSRTLFALPSVSLFSFTLGNFSRGSSCSREQWSNDSFWIWKNRSSSLSSSVILLSTCLSTTPLLLVSLLLILLLASWYSSGRSSTCLVSSCCISFLLLTNIKFITSEFFLTLAALSRNFYQLASRNSGKYWSYRSFTLFMKPLPFTPSSLSKVINVTFISVVHSICLLSWSFVRGICTVATSSFSIAGLPNPSFRNLLALSIRFCAVLETIGNW